MSAFGFGDLAFLGAVTPGGIVLPNIGDPFGGGYFAGLISHTADGNPTHALIVAPRATGATGTGYTLTTNLQWKTSNTATPGATSSFDGVANTAAMVAAGISNHPAAQFCVNLNIGGFADWYLPSRYELDIAYFNLKPVSDANDTAWGANIYAVPSRPVNNTATLPSMTTVSAFTSSAEAIIGDNVYHWSSTEASATSPWIMRFRNGTQTNSSKTNELFRTRAFRRITL